MPLVSCIVHRAPPMAPPWPKAGGGGYTVVTKVPVFLFVRAVMSEAYSLQPSVVVAH